MRNFDSDLRGHVFIIDRSNPNHVIVSIPPNNPNYPEFPDGKNMTRLEDIQYRIKKHGFWIGRRDIAHVYLETGKRVILDVWIDPNQDGSIDYKGTEMFFTPQQKKEIKEIIKRIQEIGKTNPEMLVLLGIQPKK